MKSILFSILALTVVSIAACTNSQAQDEKTVLSPQEFSMRIAEEEDAQLVDVRTPGEFQGGYISGAVNYDWNGDEFEQQAKELDAAKPVFVYCLSGGRSSAAAANLRKKGFEVYELDGGMMKWRSEKLPEHTGNSEKVSGLSIEDLDQLMRTDKLVVVDFYAEWCAPCKRMEPYLKRLEGDLSDVQLIRIDADKNPELCNQLNVSSLPVIQIYKNKRLEWNHLGYIGEEDLKGKIRELR